MTTIEPRQSPRWTPTTKLIIGLTLIAIAAFLLIRFQNIIAPMFGAFILAYLLYPVVGMICRRNKASWRLVVTIIYLLIFLILIGLLTWGGISIFNELTNLIGFIQRQVQELPAFLDQLLNAPVQIGPFSIDLRTLPAENLTEQILNSLQPILTRIGSIIGNLAGSAASSIWWVVISLLISYFILAETEGVQGRLLNIQLPGYGADLGMMGMQLNRVWNAFLRGQMIIILITILVYTALLGILGVRYFYALALLAGLARFIPYIGPTIAWATYGLVTLFQGYTIFGMEPFPYALLVVACAWLTDVVLDNLVVPRLWADALKIHPAAVMVSAIIGASLFGLVGVVLAAPTYATIKLLVDYTMRKMFDQDPWESIQTIPTPPPLRQRWENWRHKVREKINRLKSRISSRKIPEGDEDVTDTRYEDPNPGRD